MANYKLFKEKKIKKIIIQLVSFEIYKESVLDIFEMGSLEIFTSHNK